MHNKKGQKSIHGTQKNHETNAESIKNILNKITKTPTWAGYCGFITHYSPEGLSTDCNRSYYFKGNEPRKKVCNLIEIYKTNNIQVSSKPKNVIPVLLNFANMYWPGGSVSKGCPGQEEHIFSATTASRFLPKRDTKECGQRYTPAMEKLVGGQRDCCYLDTVNVRSFLYDNKGHLIRDDDLRPLFWEARLAAIDQRSNTSLFNFMGLSESRKRIRSLFEVCKRAGKRHLILGAWGCGHFRNKPDEIARIIIQELLSKNFSDAFDKVWFSFLPGERTHKANYNAFKNELDIILEGGKKDDHIPDCIAYQQRLATNKCEYKLVKITYHDLLLTYMNGGKNYVTKTGNNNQLLALPIGGITVIIKPEDKGDEIRFDKLFHYLSGEYDVNYPAKSGEKYVDNCIKNMMKEDASVSEEISARYEAIKRVMSHINTLEDKKKLSHDTSHAIPWIPADNGRKNVATDNNEQGNRNNNNAQNKEYIDSCIKLSTRLLNAHQREFKERFFHFYSKAMVAFPDPFSSMAPDRIELTLKHKPTHTMLDNEDDGTSKASNDEITGGGGGDDANPNETVTFFYPGAFNPLHKGHLEALAAAVNAYAAKTKTTIDMLKFKCLLLPSSDLYIQKKLQKSGAQHRETTFSERVNNIETKIEKYKNIANDANHEKHGELTDAAKALLKKINDDKSEDDILSILKYGTERSFATFKAFSEINKGKNIFVMGEDFYSRVPSVECLTDKRSMVIVVTRDNKTHTHSCGENNKQIITAKYRPKKNDPRSSTKKRIGKQSYNCFIEDAKATVCAYYRCRAYQAKTLNRGSGLNSDIRKHGPSKLDSDERNHVIGSLLASFRAKLSPEKTAGAKLCAANALYAVLDDSTYQNRKQLGQDLHGLLEKNEAQSKRSATARALQDGELGGIFDKIHNQSAVFAANAQNATAS